MTIRFTSAVGGTSVEFGEGCVARLSRTHGRVGVVCGPSAPRTGLLDQILAQLPADPPVHTTGRAHPGPADVAAAVETLAGCETVVGAGGGSVIGIAKAFAVETGATLVLVPTTYSGSEMTRSFGTTADGVKHVRRDPRAQAATVLYDPVLTRTLPARSGVPSLFNCLAHCVEAPTVNADPMVLAVAVAGIERAATGLAARADEPERADEELLLAGYLGGLALAAGGLGLHHSICHAVAGLTGASHGDINTIVLPGVIDHVLERAPVAAAALAPSLNLLGTGDTPAARLDSLRRRYYLPTRLRDTGLAQSDLAVVASRVDADSTVDNLLAAMY